MIRYLNVIALVFLWATTPFAASEDADKVSLRRHVREIPSDVVLKLDEQEALFVRAYQEVGPETIDPKTTPVPGLAAMVRQHYSFTRTFVQDSPDHMALLTQFWQRMSDIIDTNQLTVVAMKNSARQLSILLSVHKEYNGEVKLEDDVASNFDPMTSEGQLYVSGNWKNIDLYEAVFGEEPSFKCPAVLCCRSGEFAYERFNKNYLMWDFILSLSSLSYINHGDGPHGGGYTPSSFLQHDYGHELLLLDREEGVLKADWDLLRSLLRRVYQISGKGSANSKLNQRALYWLFHESDQPLFSSEEDLRQKELFFGEDLPPLASERGKFLSGLAPNVFNLSRTTAINFLMTDSGISLNTFPFEFGPYVEKDSTHVSLTLYIFRPKGEGQHSGEKENVGTFSVDVSFVPGQKKEISNLSAVQWYEGVMIERDMQGTIEERARYWFETVRESFAQSRTTDIGIIYKSIYSDEELLLTSVYGDKWLPESARANPSVLQKLEAINPGMNRFWVDFYQANKHLFSTAPLGQGTNAEASQGV